MKATLEDLLRAARDEQPGAWKELVPALERRLRRYFRRTFGEADAKDLTQTTIEAIARQLPKFTPNKSLSAWVTGIARNKRNGQLGNRYTAHDRRALLVAIDPTADTSPESRVYKQEMLALLRDEIEQMSSIYRRAIEIELEGRSIKTHARRENISTIAAGVRRHRAHKRLRKRFEARRQPSSSATPTLG